MYKSSQLIGLISIFCMLLFFSACRKEPVEIPSKDEFTKKDREKLGQLIENEIIADNMFSILPNTTPFDSSIYWYIKSLYKQVTQSIHLDNQSPTNDRWSQEREWKVFIINDDNLKTAFILPGGNLYISTGLLKSLNLAYELYYFLAFEATLMNETFLFTRLIEEYNTITIRNLLDGELPANAVTIDEIAEDFPDLVFEAETVFEIDKKTADLICGTSIFDRRGIVHFLSDSNNTNSKWLNIRTNYENRISQINGFETSEELNCGGSVGNNGDYENYVLNVLE